jgi:hypothetical protein
MQSINEQIEFGINQSNNRVKKIIIPYYWFSYSFTRIPDIKFEGHDNEVIEFYDGDDNCISKNVTSKIY